jgi:nucleotide-binding universal stress UspA family protein
VEGRGPVAEAIVAIAEERGCDFVLMGSYRYAPWLESMIGGVLERVLRSGRLPVLVT